MRVCVLLEKLNELSKKEKPTTLPPLAAPSAYSEVFDRCVLNIGSAYMQCVLPLGSCYICVYME